MKIKHLISNLKRDLEKAKELLQDPSTDVNATDNSNWTPLVLIITIKLLINNHLIFYFKHEACYQGNLEMIKLLIEHNANINAPGRHKNTPLHVASVSKTLTAMAILKLVEVGKLKLHQKVTDFFPKFPYPDVEVFHLITHRIGLPKYEYLIDEMKLKPSR